jgi:hypothetical protein
VSLVAQQAEQAATSPATGSEPAAGLRCRRVRRRVAEWHDRSRACGGAAACKQRADGLAMGDAADSPGMERSWTAEGGDDRSQLSANRRAAPRSVSVADSAGADPHVHAFEGNIHSYRQIFMDGRKHPEDPDPTWYGHSVGKWEGDTLVIDSVGFNDKFWFDFIGTPHTEKLHTIERYTRTNIGTLVIETTIDDPGQHRR